MTVKQIIQQYLEANGYDGLYLNNVPEQTCGCLLRQGLAPCDCMNEECQPGYSHADGLMYAQKENSDAR